jgi:putative colanic acid biosynthesis glycosyltransferase WcaI
MRLLIVSQWYPPEPVRLLAELAESLQSRGHDVEVLTGFPNYPHGTIYPGYKQRLIQRELRGGVRVVRVPLYPDHSRSSIKRVLNYLSFALTASFLGPFVTQRPDVVFVYGTPYTTALPGWLVSRIKRAPVVFELLDLWPESLAASGMLSNRFALRVVHFFTRAVHAFSAAVLVITDGFRRALLADGVPEEKIHVVSNWVDVDFFRPLSVPRRDRNFKVLFAGNLGPMQGVETIVGAAGLLREQSDIEILIAGDGIALSEMAERVRQEGLTNVRFLGRRPESEMPALFASVDALLVHLKAEPLLEITIPHKIFAYMASGKPIIAAVRGDAASIVEDARAGICCAPGSPEAMAEAIRGLAVLDPDVRDRLGSNGRQAAVTKYNREFLVGRIEEVIRGVCKPDQ